MQKWMGWSIIRAKMWKSLGTKAHQGPTWLNVKCVFGENLKKKKSHHLCASKERLILEEEQRPTHSLIAFPVFSHFLSFSCASFFSAPPTKQLSRRLTVFRGRCWPWRWAPWCGQSCRSCRGCVHPKGSSLGYLPRTGDRHSPHSGSNEHGNHDPEPQSGQSPPGLGLAW